MNHLRLPSLAWILLFQVVLTVIVPPLAWGARSLFMGDLFFLLWPLPYLYQAWMERPESRRFLGLTLFGSALIFGWVGLHGAYRPSLVDELLQVQMGLEESDRFNLFRETIITARFLSWLWAGIVVGLYRFSPSELRLLQRSLIALTLTCSLIMIACKLIPDVSVGLGKVYGYNPNAFPWQGRIYGVFRSPNEAGIFFGMALTCLLNFWEERNVWLWLVGIGAVCSVVVAQSATTMITGVLILITVALMWMKGWIRWGVIGITAAIGAWLYPTIHVPGTFLHGKIVNFVYRFGPWKVYWKAAVSRLDLLLFGFGWTNYHVDNFYVFLLNRGGLLLLGAAIGWCLWLTRRYWRHWSRPQKIIFLFAVFSGLTIDTLILRPVVALFVCMAIPLLAESDRKVSA